MTFTIFIVVSRIIDLFCVISAELEFIDSASSSGIDLDSLSSSELRAECDKLILQNGTLRKELAELKRGKSNNGLPVVVDGDVKVQELQTELQHAKEALSGIPFSLNRLLLYETCTKNVAAIHFLHTFLPTPRPFLTRPSF